MISVTRDSDQLPGDMCFTAVSVLFIDKHSSSAQSSDCWQQHVVFVEHGLSCFHGFVAFACKTRADSPIVIGALLDSAHRVIMITGDAPLTALHVAREVKSCVRALS